MKLDLWVRLNITMVDDNKVSGWTQIYGKHELAMYKKPFKSLKPIVNDHIEKTNWLAICNRWSETNQVIEVNTSKIKKYVIKECVQPCEEEEWGLVRKWYREHSRKEREKEEKLEVKWSAGPTGPARSPVFELPCVSPQYPALKVLRRTRGRGADMYSTRLSSCRQRLV